ncbi:Holliday junction resolvase RuvX [Mycoplasma tauri]|uniref:Putative pre-16S rRNA nuclease n=1 Tax=Mycoplasma tauri TaxID=547987 RepID=A0A953NGD7_9MOLU|nr:Holliday junction resolvase RuvX [Mycoplasma tauri]MBZ4195549.1 Holliday junction resolvase RuvX [Mycoplasma tauri]MBZ4203492.1 Holliday junction resolvase RuvX [Mycoplasma tauri]MBZ4204136.1 Holliday junction resolvase RuvX [Mycoplasma tauri]MBZ4212462.1 Holliday junction resolvase RuvX [Mycoplasma tauri]MBZ4218111.1 Holliday junction resolvase RuvX [Mycoplasma tauri]
MRKLAFDLGTRTCGFAISDFLEISAQGLETIRFDENDFKTVIKKTNEYIKKYQSTIDCFVLGYPLRSNGTKSERTIMVENFAQILHDEFPNIPIFLTEEYGSTIKATNILKEANLSIKKVKKNKDTISAVIILNDFLNYGGKKYEF